MNLALSFQGTGRADTCAHLHGIYTPAVIYTALTIPAVRKIRARYVAGKCNAALGFKLRDNYAAAQPYELVDELVFTQAGVSISRENTHSCDYAHDVCALRQGERRVCGVELIKDEAAA